jgi:hypothetical protein
MELSRNTLFEIPLWRARFDEVLPYHEEMAREVEELIDGAGADAAPRFLAHQTPSDPFLLPSPGWKLLESLSNHCYQSLARQNFQRWRSGEFHLRRWAIRLGRLNEDEKASLERDCIHNHLPALFSSIYYLRIPAELAGQDAGGTLFLNPIANLMDLMGPRAQTISPEEGLFLIFPSFVDHRPLPCRWDCDAVPRIVVSSDVFYVSGRTARGLADERTTLPAEPAGGP